MSANNKELEVKFLLQNLDKVIKKLEEVGAILTQPRTYERNLRFDTPKRRLTQNEQVLRLRKDRNNLLTYKGPSENKDGVSARTEIEFTVGSFDKAQDLLEALGFQVSMIYEKYRTIYKLNDTLVTLDEMPFGIFAEIEGKDSITIQGVCNQLGLIWEQRTLLSYAQLFQIVKENLKQPFRDLTFENFAEIKVKPGDFDLLPTDMT